MWILNVTPDSFYDGGQFIDSESARHHIETMIAQWVDIIDVWGFSSRPGAKIPSVEQELSRIIPVLEVLQDYDIPVSVDTFRSEVVAQVLQYDNVKYINDVTGLSDENILPLLKQSQVSYVLMHTQGMPEHMQDNPNYSDIIAEISHFFEEKIALLQAAGVENIILDPGFWFGKTLEHNYLLFKHIQDFRHFWCPLFAGISRKSMIYRPLQSNSNDVLPETVALGTLLMCSGIDILRVHDVGEHVNMKKLLWYLK